MASIPAPATASPFRRALVALGVVVALLAGASQLNKLFRGGLSAPVDFAAFWAAGKLTAEGANPYSGDHLRDAQAAVGLTDLAVIAWNPPWTLTFLMPFGALDFRAAYGLWVLVHLALVATSALLLWRAFDGPKRFAWVPLVVALTFAPTVFLIGNAQLTAVVLFGVAGFIAAGRANRPLLAGAALALCATKPHLFVPLGVWLLCAACGNGFARKVLLGAVAAGALMCVPPTLAASHVWADYSAAVTGPPDPRIRPLSEWKPPLIGWWVRQAVPGTPFWVQWLPVALAACAVAGWCAKRGARPSQVPWLVGVSLLVAPYGAWSYDLVLLLVPLLAVAARTRDRRAVAAGVALLASVNAVSLAMMLGAASSEWYVWFAPVVLMCVWRLGKPPPLAPAEPNPPAPFPGREGGAYARNHPRAGLLSGSSIAEPPPSLLGKGAGGLGSTGAGGFGSVREGRP